MKPTMMKTCAAIALLMLMLCAAGCAFAESDAELWASYQADNVRIDGKAYLEMMPSVTPVRLSKENVPVWRFGVLCREVGGLDFTADTFICTFFDEEQNVVSHGEYVGAEYEFAGQPSEFPTGEFVEAWINHPEDSSAYFGIRFVGKDSAGNPCSFHTIFPLSHELTPAETPDEFRAEDEGDSLISLTPAEDPVYLQQLEFFDGGLGWASAMTVANVSDVPVEITGMTLVVYTESEDIIVRVEYSGPGVAYLCGLESNVLAPGESFDYNDLAPYQDLSGYGFRFTAKTEDGRTQTANCYFSCVKEEKSE